MEKRSSELISALFFANIRLKVVLVEKGKLFPLSKLNKVICLATLRSRNEFANK
jgi:hypothetical protein